MKRVFIFVVMLLLVAGCGVSSASGSLINPAVDAPQWVHLIAMFINMLPAGSGGELAAVIVGVLSALFFGALFIFRALAEVLGYFYKKTSTNTDDKLFKFFGQAALFCAKIIAMFGFGYPPKLK